MKKNYLPLIALMMCVQLIYGQSTTTSSTSQTFIPKVTLVCVAAICLKVNMPIPTLCGI